MLQAKSTAKKEEMLDVFEARAAIMKETDTEIKYQMRCDTQSGFMHCYFLFIDWHKNGEPKLTLLSCILISNVV